MDPFAFAAQQEEAVKTHMPLPPLDAGAAPTFGDEEAALHANKVTDALARGERKRQQLYREDGRPLYSPVEFKQREETISAEVTAVIDAAEAAADKLEATSNRAIKALRDRDPVELLSSTELERASAIAVFVDADSRDLPMEEIASRIESLIADVEMDRALAATWLRFGKRRIRGELARVKESVSGSRGGLLDDHAGEGISLQKLDGLDQRGWSRLQSSLALLEDRVTGPSIKARREQVASDLEEARSLRQFARHAKSTVNGTYARARQEVAALTRATF